MEELEALQAIYGDDIRITHGSPSFIEFPLGPVGSSTCKHFLQLEIQDEYPDVKPKVRVIGNLCNGSLEKLIEDFIESKSQPGYLFDVIQTALKWMEENGVSSEEAKISQKKDECSVCKFFLENKCRFGEQCHFQHPVANLGKFDHPLEAEMSACSASSQGLCNNENIKLKEVQDKKFLNQSKDNGDSRKFDKKKVPMKTATDVIKRIMWDESLPAEDFTVGYIDRFIGIVEKSFNSFSWEDIASVDYSTLAIPKHRIQYFKYKDKIVWDKRTRLDKVFGSTGNTERILDIIENYQATSNEDASASKMAKNDVKLDVLDPETEDCDNDYEEKEVLRKNWKDDDRPNFFFCFRITDNEAKEKICKVQTEILSRKDILKDGCLKPNEYHVTLCMLRLNKDEEKTKAIKVMEDIQETLVCMFPSTRHLLLKNIGNFRGRVLHVEVKDDSLLSKFVRILILKLKAAGLSLCGNQEPYCPHVTILKLSRPMCRNMNTSVIDPSYYFPYKSERFGTQAFNKIRLCSTSKQRDETGFYIELASKSSSLFCISEDLPKVVSFYVNELTKRSILSEIEGDIIIEALLTKDPDKFETAICDFERILEERVTDLDKEHVVIIMRGLPGSGKSRLVAESMEMRQAQSSACARKRIVVCGADEHFENSQSRYEYVSSELDMAHSYCRHKFVTAIADNVNCIVIDNTNSQTWEYQIYKRIAKLCGYQARCLEMSCKNEETLEAFVKRGEHNVGKTTVMRMWQRWEADEDSVHINPRFESCEMFSLICLINEKKTEEKMIPHSKGILFSAVFLDNASRAKLLELYPPVHSKITASHMTLTYRPMKEEIPHIPVGKKHSLSIIGHVCNDVLQAVAVSEIGDTLCGTEIPHITIANTKKAAPKHAKNALENIDSWEKPVDEIILTGVVGVQVAISEKKSKTITDFEKFQEILSQLNGPSVQEPIAVDSAAYCDRKEHLSPEIYIGSEMITSLFVFDFDGTLFHTPDPALGRRQYKDLTGEKWPHKGWIARPESLQFPLHSYPGPSFNDFKEHIEMACSLTVLLTARLECTMDGVKEVLCEYGIHPQKLLLKPDSDQNDYKTNRSPNFKAGVIKDLLKTYPNVNHVKIWDDRQDNIDMFRRVRKSFDKIKFEFFKVDDMSSDKIIADCKDITTVIDAFGFGNVDSFCSAAKEGIDFIINTWSTCLDVESKVGKRLGIPFGSYPLHRIGDVDLCLLAPSNFKQYECILKLEAELSKRGIKHLHSATRIRCPRLKVRLHFLNAAPVDFDIVFATCLDDLNDPEIDIAMLYKHGSKAVKSALEGVLFLEQVRNCIDGKICVEDFGKLIDIIVLYLKTKHLKGNAFHCIRTFHIVRALAEMFMKSAPGFNYINDNFKNSLQHLSSLDISYWKRICKDFVPDEILHRFVQLFKDAVRMTTETESIWNIFGFVKFPPDKNTVVTISVKSHVRELLWRAITLAEARLGTCIRTLISSGVDVVPGPSDYSDTIKFAIPANEWCIMLCKDTLKNLENEAFFIDNRENLEITIDYK